MGGREENPNWFEPDEREPRYASRAELSERRRPVSGVPAQGRPVSGVPAQGPPVPPPRTRGPRSGQPMPPPMADPLRDPLPPNYPADSTYAMREETSAVDAATLRRKVAENDGLYRSKNPVFLALFGGLAVFGDLLMLPPLIDGMFGKATGPALAPLLALIAFPLLAIAMYSLVTGAATAVQFQGPRVWLRAPLVYLPIALALLIAAGAAA